MLKEINKISRYKSEFSVCHTHSSVELITHHQEINMQFWTVVWIDSEENKIKIKKNKYDLGKPLKSNQNGKIYLKLIVQKFELQKFQVEKSWIKRIELK